MGFWRFQGLVILRRPRAVRGHAESLKNLQFLSFFQKNDVALEFWTPFFRFLMNAPANFVVFA